jgi:hypothetical protein
MKRRGLMTSLAWSLAAASAISCTVPMQVRANNLTNFDVRKKVIGLSGIMGVSGDLTRKVTRAQFARMLVKASAYRSVLTDTSNVSVFSDVAQGNEYASAIRLAAENGWMTGYLGGNFRPDQYVTLNEAAKGVEYLLGYAATDFSGDEYNKRMAKYAFLDLNDNISYTDPATIMTVTDCINLFYNLMKCKKKDTTTAYATVLGATLSSDGEVNALSMADNTLRGPKLVRTSTDLATQVPFGLDTANIFLNGEGTDRAALESALTSYMVLYYSTETRTLWAYTASSDSTSDKRVASGTIKNIYYSSTSTVTPSKVTIDDVDNGEETFTVSNSDMQFAFSIYGSLHVGDQVTVIYEASSTSSDDDSSSSSSSSSSNSSTSIGSIIDYVED